MPTLQVSKTSDTDGTAQGSLVDAICFLQRVCCCVESYRSMRALILFNKPSASWSSVAKACLTMS